MRLLKKLSAKELCGEMIRFKEGETYRELYKLAGEVSGFDSGETQYGEWYCFLGKFVAMLPNGESAMSSKAFIPEPYESILLDQYKKLKEGESVMIKLEVGIIPSKRKNTNDQNFYEYVVTVAGAQETATKLLDYLKDESPNV